MRPIEIFRAGEHTSSDGRTLRFSEADVANTAAAYDPALHEAPIVVGHPKTDDPAYGWAGSLAYADGKLTAAPKDVDPAFAALVQAGRYKKVSASFYEPGAANNPTPGVYYLRHIGFLGAQPPAVKGLKQVAFADEAQTVTIEFSDAANSGGEDAPGLYGRIMAGVAKLLARERAEFFELENIDMGEKTAEQKAADAAAETALKEREEKLKADEAAFAETQRKVRAGADAALVEQLVKDGKLPPGHKADTLAFMAALDHEKTVEFGEGDGKAKKTPRDWFREMIGGAKPVICFAELSADDKSKGDQGGDAPTAEQIGAETTRLVDEAAKAGRALSYAEAGVQAAANLKGGKGQ